MLLTRKLASAALVGTLIVTACSDKPNASGSTTPAPPATRDAGADYVISDTSAYRNLVSEGKLGILRRAGVYVDSIDLAFGLQQINADSLIFLPVRSSADGAGGIATSITDHVLFDGTTRTLIKDIVPDFDSHFSSPSLLQGALYYWGLSSRNGIDSVNAVRYEFARRRLNKIPVSTKFAGTDNRFYFTPPYIERKEFVFKSPDGEWRFRTPKQ